MAETVEAPVASSPVQPELGGIGWRRLLMLALVGGTLCLLLGLVAHVLSGGGLDLLEIAIIACIAVSAPMTILGFWNTAIGLCLVLFRRDPLRTLAPFTDVRPAPLSGRVAVAMTLRNEDPSRAFTRLLAVRGSLEATGAGADFDIFILSDTSDPVVAQAEERLFSRHRGMLAGSGEAHYRRRAVNTGFKAGNVWEFLTTRGDAYTIFFPLDADSTMSGETILRMARIMEANPRIGILQALALGAPADSAFARIYQFGVRHGSRAFNMGAVWWQGDCGAFWGHNAAVRIEPFLRHCKLPVLKGKPPLGGPILSHDLVEGAMMRAGGYEVRLIPAEMESYEDNPVTLFDFIKRAQRWCNGNMQFPPLLRLPGVPSVSRMQLVQAIMNYTGAAAWMLMVVLGVIRAIAYPLEGFDKPLAIAIFLTMVGMSLAPKFAGIIHTLSESGGTARHGGARRFGVSAFMEIVFSVLMAPVVAVRMTIFLVGLAMGKRIEWNGQNRDAYGLGWGESARALWPQTLLGLALLTALIIGAPRAIPWASPVITGLLLSIPFAVLTASPRFGAWLKAHRLCAIPEDLDPPPVLEAVRDRPVEAVA